MDDSLTGKQQAALNGVMTDAIRKKDWALLELCIAKGADPQHHFELPAGYADLTGSGPSPVVFGTVFHYVCAFYFTAKLADFFLHRGVPVDAADSEGSTALSRAVRKQKDDVVAYLLAHGGDPLRRNTQNTSPLDEAYALPPESAVRARILAIIVAALPNRSVDGRTIHGRSVDGPLGELPEAEA